MPAIAAFRRNVMKKSQLLMSCLLVGVLLFSSYSRARGGHIFAAPGEQDASATADLQALIPALIKDARIPGLQVALIRDGRIVWHGNFGVRNTASGGPVMDETIFEAASLTKPVFAFYVMMLCDQGLLDLDKPLIGYVPGEFFGKLLEHPLDEKGFRRDWFERITIRQILSHSSGMPHGEGGRPFPLFFEPGTKWKYSADGYYFVQRVIETLKGDTLDHLMQKAVFGPLGMARSSLVWRKEYEMSMANGHTFFGKTEGFRKRTKAHAGASLYTTAEDYAKFVCAVVNGELLRPETRREMIKPRIDMDKERGVGWSLGFGTQSDERGLAVWQWGDYEIFRNFAMAYPAERSGVVYMTNSFFGLGISQELVAHSIGGQALGSMALNHQHYDWPVYRAGWDWTEKGPAAGGPEALAEKYPEAFSKNGMEFLFAMFEKAGRLGEFTAPLRFYAAANPKSGKAQHCLAKALIMAGEWRKAREPLEKARKAKEDRAQPASLKWTIEHVHALEKPKQLKESHLRKIAGTYGARQIELRNGHLYYFRKGGSLEDFAPLVALAKNSFILETLPFFRLKIEFDKKGNPVRAIGIYEDGRREVMIRNDLPPKISTHGYGWLTALPYSTLDGTVVYERTA
jgi:CubicO group peptidase (beta-lactamase class C family)